MRCWLLEYLSDSSKFPHCAERESKGDEGYIYMHGKCELLSKYMNEYYIKELNVC